MAVCVCLCVCRYFQLAYLMATVSKPIACCYTGEVRQTTESWQVVVSVCSEVSIEAERERPLSLWACHADWQPSTCVQVLGSGMGMGLGMYRFSSDDSIFQVPPTTHPGHGMASS